MARCAIALAGTSEEITKFLKGLKDEFWYDESDIIDERTEERYQAKFDFGSGVTAKEVAEFVNNCNGVQVGLCDCSD